MRPVTSNAVANMYEEGSLPADTQSGVWGTLKYILNKITNEIFIYGRVGSSNSTGNYRGYVTTLPTGYVHDSTAFFFDCAATGTQGTAPAKVIVRIGGSNGQSNEVAVRYYDSGYMNADVAVHTRVKSSS